MEGSVSAGGGADGASPSSEMALSAEWWVGWDSNPGPMP